MSLGLTTLPVRVVRSGGGEKGTSQSKYSEISWKGIVEESSSGSELLNCSPLASGSPAGKCSFSEGASSQFLGLFTP